MNNTANPVERQLAIALLPRPKRAARANVAASLDLIASQLPRYKTFRP